MKKAKLLFSLALVAILVFPILADDAAKKIGELGDEEWNKIIQEYKDNNKYTDLHSTNVLVANFKNYQGKLMLFPKINFEDFVTDKDSNKYYYYGEKNTFAFYVIKYNNEITSKLQKLSYVFGKLGDTDWEVIGTVEDAYEWWGNIVLMDIKALRIPGKACAVVNDGKVTLVGEDLIDQELAKKEKESSGDIPKNLKSIPKGLDPLMIAKLFFHISSIEKNENVWDQLLSSECFYNGQATGKVTSWWRNLTTKNRTYFYVREDKDRSTNDTKVYYFQIKENGENVSTPKPTTIIKEKGEWKVDSATP